MLGVYIRTVVTQPLADHHAVVTVRGPLACLLNTSTYLFGSNGKTRLLCIGKPFRMHSVKLCESRDSSSEKSQTSTRAGVCSVASFASLSLSAV